MMRLLLRRCGVGELHCRGVMVLVGGGGVPAATGAVAEDAGEVRCSEERLGTGRHFSIWNAQN